MLNRSSALWLLLGAIGGYALTGSSVTAQSGALASPPALNPGNTVRLTFEHGTYSATTDSVNCVVADLQTKWIRCKAADPIQEEREQRWYSLDRVILITKQER
jgi:hypothetical protein